MFCRWILLVNDDDSNDYQISLWLSTHYFTMLFISDVISTWLSSEDGWWEDGWTMDDEEPVGMILV